MKESTYVPILAYTAISAILNRQELCPGCDRCASMLPSEGHIQIPVCVVRDKQRGQLCRLTFGTRFESVGGLNPSALTSKWWNDCATQKKGIEHGS